MPANWTAIEDAFYDWAAGESGLSVLWSNQNTPQPSSDFITLRMDTNAGVGLGQTATITDLSRTNQEVETRHYSTRECSIVVDALSTQTIGTTSAYRVLERLQLSLSKLSVRETFDAAGCTIFDAGSIQNVPQLVEADIQGRATMRLRFYVMDDVSELVGYIATVETVDLTDDDEITN